MPPVWAEILFVSVMFTFTVVPLAGILFVLAASVLRPSSSAAAPPTPSNKELK